MTSAELAEKGPSVDGLRETTLDVDGRCVAASGQKASAAWIKGGNSFHEQA